MYYIKLNYITTLFASNRAIDTYLSVKFTFHDA